MADLTLSVRLTADGSGFVGAIKLSRDELDKLGKASAGAGRATKGLADDKKTLGSVVAATTLRVRDLVGAYLSLRTAQAVLGGLAREITNAEKVSARLDAVLRATGQAAGFTRQQLDALAESLAKTTLFDDESIRQAIAVMATFRSVQGDTFRQAIEAATNLSGLLGGDLPSAALTLGKALQDPAEGLTALQRAGIKFGDEQKDLIQRLDETGRKAEAQKIILEGLSGVTGVATAQNTGLTGALAETTKAWDDLLKAFGRSPAAQGVVVPFLKLVGQEVKALGDLIRGELSIADYFSGKNLPPPAAGAVGAPTPPPPTVELGANQRAALRELSLQTSLIGQSRLAEEQAKALKGAGFEPLIGAAGDVTVKDFDKLHAVFRNAVERIKADVASLNQADFGERLKALQRETDTAEQLRVGRALGPDALAGIAGTRRAIDVAAQNRIADPKQIQDLKDHFTALERANQSLQLTNRLYDELRGPQEDFAQRQRVIARELASGGISAEEARRATRAAYMDMLDASREWEDGVKRGLVRTLDDAGNLARGFENLTVGAFQRSENAFVQWARTGKLAAGDLFGFLEEELLRLAYRAFILKPILGPLEEGLTGFAKGLFGPTTTAGNPLGSVTTGFGTTVSAGTVFHGGGVVGSTPAPRRVVPAEVFENAPRFHVGGPIAPGERGVIAHDGEVIGWPEQLRRAFGSDVKVEIIDQRGAGAPPIEEQRSRGPDGQDTIRFIVRREMASAFNDGALDREMRTNFALARSPATRRS